MEEIARRPVYVIVTPVRDEERYVDFTLRSVTTQTVFPAEWIIVDDGSTDRTRTIAEEYAQRYSWIRVIPRTNRGFRNSGAGVVEAFYDGYSALTCHDWEFIVKLDGDLSLPKSYFEDLFESFRTQPKLGIGGGILFDLVDGQLKPVANPSFHVRGATKIYRRLCWEAIGGLWPGPGWDTIDEVKANMLGWTTKTLPEVHVVHHRLTGAANGNWRESVKNGRGSYVAGYHPLYLIARCIYRLPQRPFLIGFLGMLWGYSSGYLQRLPQVDDRALIRYLRRQQLARLLGRDTIWR